MSVEAGLGAVEAVGQATKQNPAEIQQAVLVAGQSQLAQDFELGLVKASETSAASFQASEEARRKGIEVAQREALNVSEATQIEVRPSDHQGDLGKDISSYMQGFQGRTSGYSSDLEDFISKLSGGAKASGIETAGSAPDAASKDNAFNAASALHVVERSFEFAIEAELVSNASKHSTQVFNDLMKGQ
jgi:hypothetical protein